MARRGRKQGSRSKGASIEQTGLDTWRIRWTQIEDGKRRQKQHTIRGTETDAEAYRAVVIHDKQTKGYHDPDEYRAKYAPAANLLDGMFAWLDATAEDGLKASTEETYRGLIKTLSKAIHEAEGIPVTEQLPVTLLGRPLFDKLKPVLKRRGVTVPRRALLQLWNTWGWLADDPVTWARVPRRPSTRRGYVPPKKKYGRTIAPTLAECDAVLRQLRGLPGLHRRSELVGLALIMRYTGLRVGQVQALRRADIDLNAGTLVVRTGKSRQEAAAMRPVPLSRHLLAEPLFRALLEGKKADARVVRIKNTKSIVNAWEAATAAGEVPRHTWAPENREYARPDHAFRAALQAHMIDESVAPDVVSHLVGHRHGMRGTHYGRKLMEPARVAVDALPPVDWTGPEVPEGVVSIEAYRAG